MVFTKILSGRLRQLCTPNTFTMPVYPSQRLLEGLSDHADAFLQKAVSEWQVISHEIFSRQPSPGKWSANQCIAHLNEYGRYYLPAIEAGINRAIALKPSPALHFKAGWLGNYFTEMMLTNAEGAPRKKMSAPKSYAPENTADSAAVIAEFIDQQEQLLSLLRKAKQIDLNKIWIPVSIAKFIKLKLGDLLLFLTAHNYRHIMQAERALQPEHPTPLEPFLLSGFA